MKLFRYKVVFMTSGILTAIGKGQQAKFVQIIGTFVSIGLAITAISKVISRIM